MSGFDVTGNLTGTLSSDKLGVTTTVKEQVENIEVSVGRHRLQWYTSKGLWTSSARCRASWKCR